AQPAFTLPQSNLRSPALASEAVLANGLRLVVLPDATAPVVACLACYKVGARHEQMGATGLSHLVEHLLFGQVGPFRKGEIGATIARYGGQFNAYTSDDFTVFFEILPAYKLDLALQIESQRMRSAVFSPAVLKDELANIRQEFDAESRDPFATLAKEV